MKRKSMRLWLGSCLVSLASAAGCQHAPVHWVDDGGPCPQCCPAANGPQTPPTGEDRGAGAPNPAPPANPYSGSPYAASRSYGGGHPAPSPADKPADTVVVQGLPSEQTTVRGPDQPSPVITQAGYTEPAEAPLPASGDLKAPGPADQAAGQPAAAPAPTPFGRDAEAPRRKSYVDLTAAPCFAHAGDYSWLRGQVEYSRLSKGWRIRYASVDEVDRYGGGITLIENKDLDRLKDGQYVTVHGHLSSPDEAGASATYRVDSFEVITNPNSEGPSTKP